MDEQKNRFNALDNWFLSDLGMQIAKAFIKELEPISDLFLGKSLIQLGSCGKNFFLSPFCYRDYWIVSPDLTSSLTLVSHVNQLPFERNSVDCVLAPLVFEALSYDKSPIDEIDRILKPMGHVIFFGINPFSLWGLWLHSKKNCFASSKLKTKSVFSIKRAMMHRNYMQCHLSSFYYLPPFKNPKILDKLKVFNELGKLITPLPPAFYCLVMQKYEEDRLATHFSSEKRIFLNSSLPLQPTCRKSDIIR